MSETTNKPVVFLAFANDRDDHVNYLRNLPEEARRIREPLQRARRDGLCDLVELANATADDIFRVFQDPEYRNRIAVFHYGGHANGYQILLESADGSPAAADAGGLAAFLGQQQGLQLAFLNGCSTEQQVQGLLDANVSAVIATSRAIDDQVAMQFAKQFYQALAGGSTLRTAYNETEAAVRTTQGGGGTRALYFGDAEQQDQGHTGADRWPWELYVRDGAENVADWSLPTAVGDPLFGLPPVPEQDLPDSPFRHLHWFDREHAELFFGRGHQIRQLYELVTSLSTPPIVLLYGQSGVGKSSMLAAGLIPRLEPAYEVRYLRRRQEDGLLETMRSTFLAAGTSVSVTRSIHFSRDWLEVEQQQGKPLIVILDQVEEVFTRPNPDLPHEMDDLLNELEAMFGKRHERPRGRLILGFRKEWLAEIEARLAEQHLSRAKVFLERLGRLGVMEAVRGPTRSKRLQTQYGLTVEEGLDQIIADDLLADAESAIAPTLQILLTKMWTKATAKNYEHPHFSLELYQQLKRDGILLRDFLNQQIAAFRERYPEAVESGLLLDLVALHTTPLGTADQCSFSHLQQQYAHLGDSLQDVLQQCQDLRLLTVAASTELENTKTTRLAHDTLAPLIREQFEESDKPGQRARRILDNRSVDWDGDREGTPLDEADLKVVEEGTSGTRTLSSTEQRLLEASRSLQAKLQRNRKILKIAGAVAAALIVIAAGVATLKSIEAGRERNDAIAARDEAETRKQEAEKSRDAAGVARDEAEQAFTKSLLNAIGHDGRPSDVVEMNALWDLAETDNEKVRGGFIKMALETDDTAARLQRRLDLAVHAAVGLDPVRKQEAVKLLVEKLEDKAIDLDVRVVYALVGVELETRDQTFVIAAARALVEAMVREIEPDASETLASGLEGQSEATTATTSPHASESLMGCFEALVTQLTLENASVIASQIREASSHTTALDTQERLASAFKAVATGVQSTLTSMVVEKRLDSDAADDLKALLNAQWLEFDDATRSKVLGKAQTNDLRNTSRPSTRSPAVASTSKPGAAEINPASRELLTQTFASIASKLKQEDAASKTKGLVEAIAIAATSSGPGAPMIVENRLKEIAGELAPQEIPYVAKTIAQAMAKTDDAFALGILKQAFNAVAGKLDVEQRLFVANSIAEATASASAADSRKCLAGVFENVAGQLDKRQLVEAAKFPTCTGALRKELVTAFAAQVNQAFNNIWSMSEWIHSRAQQQTEEDAGLYKALTTPAKRPPVL